MSRTIDQVWSEPIEHGMPWIPGYEIPVEFRGRYVSLRPIRPVRDYTHDDRLKKNSTYDWGTRLQDAFYKYSATAARNALSCPWWKPKLNGRFDEFRYWLHLQLLRWKVIV